MSDDWAEDVARLHDEVDRTAQRYEDAVAHIEPVTASDPTGSVSVTLDKDGLLQDVKVEGTWRKSLEPSALGAAVQEAIMTAAAQRTETWSTRLAEQSDEPESRARPMAPPSESLAGKLTAAADGATPGPPAAALEELLQLLKAINTGIDEATSEIGAHLAKEYAGRSSSGHVRATINGTCLIKELTYEQRWIEKAHHFNVGRETMEAVHDARQKMANHGVQDIIDGSSLGEVLALANDPTALAERLRLRG
jgi:DNA-binding protein YbaB